MKKAIVTININRRDAALFDVREVALSGTPKRMLSEQIPKFSFRLLSSDKSYSSSWHVASDPTLLLVLSGCFRVQLRSGEHREFLPGEISSAEDNLKVGVSFDHSIHGHGAEAVGDTPT